MSEIRQIQVDGITYDLVVAEDEVSATAAAQSAAEALAYKNEAQASANTAVQSAQDAEDAADRAEAIVGGEFVSYGQDQGLTDAQKGQAKKNIGAGSSNYNLLDNPFFTVNQRGQASYSAGTSYNVDRWVLFGSSPNSVTVNSDYISVASGNNGFAQYIPTELASFLNGKTITLSVMDYNGNVASGTLTYSNTALQSTYQLTVDGVSGCRLYCGLLSGKQLGASLTVGTGNTVRIKAIKLELGSVSTLANDVPPDYGTELLKCMRYFVRQNMSTNQSFAYGFAQTTTNIRFGISMPAVMRAAPSVSYAGSLNVVGDGAKTAVTALGASQFNGGHLVTFNATVASATQYEPYILTAASVPTYIDFSADL